jgi:gluconokinase
MFFGLSLNHRKEHMIRSVLEGVIYSMYSVALALESLAGEAKEIRASGGFSRSPLWRQILADVFGNEVTIPVHYESTCLGAAILGMWALGEIDSFEEAQDLAGAVNRHRPIVENVNTYRKLMAIYRRVYDHLLDEFEAIAEFQRSVGRHGTN